ncbi:MAG: phosphoribosylanthranilate isomerase [Moorella humiferrea]|uniref:N-(5'-phosphoribosyl)anthranilate isomerase n=1 Tax=Neomoorella humiferrea TaxID=676965 RepID=A0A2T0AVH2_9FIRM|nr:phosphoribosylanthranilate isomerase [Moorella humiferrea]MBE3571365.1 phosphoribosylanthranilate isomerase [Moorella humiferrea]PRR74694.1 N-(5'-phosphoribosyl)anthranilate isomerase [Moorella humiferrea]
MIRIKICGIRSYEEARMVLDAGIDVMGFVFAPSPRRINPETAREIIQRLPPFTTTVGVFVNEPRYSLLEIASFCRLDVLQLHGDEPPEYCRGISQRVVKALRVKDAGFLQVMDHYPDVHGFLLDTYVPGVAGGSGRSFNWELAKGATARGKPIILAGGLTPENVGKAIQIIRPYAVDVAGGVETDGRKDLKKILSFVRAVREAEKRLML